MGPNQTWKLLHSKGNHWQNEKTTYWMGEKFANGMDKIHTIAKWYGSKTQTTQLENGQNTWTDVFPKKIYKCQQAHEKMLNITIDQWNANQTTVRYHFPPVRIAITKKARNECWWRCGEKGTIVHC